MTALSHLTDIKKINDSIKSFNRYFGHEKWKIALKDNELIWTAISQI